MNSFWIITFLNLYVQTSCSLPQIERATTTRAMLIEMEHKEIENIIMNYNII